MYHCMTRTVNGERLFGDREKEVLRRMIWQVSDFCGVQVLTYCVMSNHFHVLVRVPCDGGVSDAELLRRYRVLYPEATRFAPASLGVLAKRLAEGGEEASSLRAGLLARMGDVSAFMKALKQRFAVWYNRSHGRFGTLWSERFKSVLVEGRGNPLQTMAAYIDLNPLRAGLVKDPKDYRFCGYAEAVAGHRGARDGLSVVWSAFAAGSAREGARAGQALRSHRSLLFGKRAGQGGLPPAERERALRELEDRDAVLPRASVLRCRVRYFTDGAILGSQAFVMGFAEAWQRERGRRRPPRPQPLRGADWGDLVTLHGLRRRVFG